MKKKFIFAVKIFGQIVVALFATAFIIVSTVLVYYYAKGYRFDLNDGNVRKTGVINIESRPSRADIYVNGQRNGKTTKTIPSINEGFTEVTLKRDGYREWSKRVPVLSEKSTPVFAELFRVEKEEDSSIEISEEFELIETYTNKRKDIFIYLTKDSKNLYSVWRYDLNRNFWNLSNNPHLITTIDFEVEKQPSILLSPSGQNISITYSFTEDDEKVTETKVYNTELTDTSGRLMDLDKFRNGYSISWSQSENFMILESNSDILSVNITTQAKSLLYKKAEKESVVWNTDSQSNYYFIQKSSDESGLYYSLEQMSLDGTGSKTLIPRIYYQKDAKYIESLRTNENIHTPFTNSPQNTRFVGEITSISIDQTTKGIYISTNYASYWYITLADKYITVSPYTSNLVSFSPDRRALIYYEAEQGRYGVFTFLKDENDPITQLGSTYILKDEESVGTISWISNNNIAYSITTNPQLFKGVFVIDKDGDNKYHIVSDLPINYAFVGSGKYLHTIEKIDNENRIVRYILQ